MPLKKKKKVIAVKKHSLKKVIKKKSIKKKAITKKVVRKKATIRKPALKKPAVAKEKGKIIGKITHYFPHVMAAVIKIKAPLAVGDTIKIKGHTSDFTQKITSMQIDRVPINTAKKGDEVGLLVNSRVRQHDTVYKI